MDKNTNKKLVNFAVKNRIVTLDESLALGVRLQLIKDSDITATFSAIEKIFEMKQTHKVFIMMDSISGLKS